MKARLLVVSIALGALAATPQALAQNCIEVRCPTNLVVDCQGPGGTPVNYVPFATNHCSSSLTRLCSPPPGSLFPPGVTTVLCAFTDVSGNSNGCTFTITVRDLTPPEIFCPRLLRAPCDRPEGGTVHFTVTASDQCDSNLTVVCNPPSGSVFPVGTNTVVCNASDDAGQMSRCTFPVIVTGDCSPDPCVSIRCPTNITLACNALGGAVANFAVRATNTCGTNVTVTCDPPSGSLFPIGLTTVLCTAEAGRASRDRCSFIVEVQDTKAPVIHCPSNLVVAAQGVDGAMVRWTATGSDECDTNVSVRCEPRSGSFFRLGITVVRCIASDGSGNETLCGFRVTVREERPFTVVHQPPASVRLRWYVTGAVEVASTLMPVPDWRPLAGTIETNGDERTLVHSLGGGLQFFRLAAPPLPRADEDSDGVPDRLDQCPGTPMGMAVDAQGCALITLATRPEQVAAGPMQRLAGLLDHLRAYPMLTDTTARAEQELAEMDVALDMIRGGQITRAGVPLGVERFGLAMQALWGTYSNLLGIVMAMERNLITNPPDTRNYADTTPEDAEVMAVRILAGKLLQCLEEAQEAEAALTGLARSLTGAGSLRGEIVEINDADRWIKLDNGTVVGLPEKEFNAALRVGAVVDLVVQNFNDGTALAESAAVLDTGVTFPGDILAVQCLHLRVVPVQEFPPFSNGPFVKHYPAAYEHGDTLWLERGMRFAVENGNCGSSLGRAGTVVRYRMKLDLYYRPVNGAYKNVTLAASLGPNSEPVAVPENISANDVAVLTITAFRQECPVLGLPSSCSDPEELTVTTYNVRVRPRYSYAVAIYQNTVFDLEDSPEETSFRAARVTSVSRVAGVLFDVPEVHFLGQGYAVFGQQSSFPNLGFITENGLQFAVYESDLYDDDGLLFKEGTLGVTNGSAIYWPRVTGYYHNRPFWYTCAVPPVTRDAVSLCGNLPHAFYRLPFKGGWPTWTMSQGNFGSFTHNGWQSYAYDLPAAQGTQIRAARGGVVESLTEGFSVSNWDPNLQQCVAFNANFVVIRHQDGTTGNYIHMPQNGVLVSAGQKVRRGDLIAQVGTTGCSTGPHLHFDVRNAAGNLTIPSRFEAWSVCVPQFPPIPAACPPNQECYVPATGDILFSNNKSWWE